MISDILTQMISIHIYLTGKNVYMISIHIYIIYIISIHVHMICMILYIYIYTYDIHISPHHFPSTPATAAWLQRGSCSKTKIQQAAPPITTGRGFTPPVSCAPITGTRHGSEASNNHWSLFGAKFSHPFLMNIFIILNHLFTLAWL